MIARNAFVSVLCALSLGLSAAASAQATGAASPAPAQAGAAQPQAAQTGSAPTPASTSNVLNPATIGQADADAAAQGQSANNGQGINVTVTADSWKNLSVAIPAFATNKNVPTPANVNGTAALGEALAQVIYDDLKDNDLFQPVGPRVLPHPTYDEITSPNWAVWSAQSVDMLVHGYVRAESNGKLVVGCYLYDVALHEELTRAGWIIKPSEWRRAAHKCSDLVYSRLSGNSPFFDSRIAYIAQTGPANHRIKRLAIMDSDGANQRFITNGQATALTPKYSPDYKQIAYLSYIDGNPRIYIYDIGTGKQHLVTQSHHPTYAPRWSPDGRYLLYSMAVDGNTDIYRISVHGGKPVRLTHNPGIDIGGSYSPDGKQIVFDSDRSGSQQCYIMNANGSDIHRISFFPGRCAEPEWSPLGDLIAFTHIVGDFHIAVMDANGHNERDLTHGWQDQGPTWSPNGQIVLFFRKSRETGQDSLWEVDVTGKYLRRLKTPLGASDPAWGPVLP